MEKEKLTFEYESVLVASAKNGEEAAQKVVDYFKGVIERHATLNSVDDWGKRVLAYEINKETEGYYVLFNFTSDAEFPAVLDRRYKITDGVLRSLIIKKDPKEEKNEKSENPVKAAVSIEKADAETEE